MLTVGLTFVSSWGREEGSVYINSFIQLFLSSLTYTCGAPILRNGREQNRQNPRPHSALRSAGDDGGAGEGRRADSEQTNRTHSELDDGDK